MTLIRHTTIKLIISAQAIISILLLSTIMMMLNSCKKSGTVPTDDTPRLGTCVAVIPKGKLSYNSSTQTYTFRTSGGGTVTITSTYILYEHDDYPDLSIEWWGNAGTPDNPMNSANHENLNGKHIKDREGLRRSFIFPDGAKITTVASETYYGPPVSISLYDGAEIHHINAACNNVLEYSGIDRSFAEKMDAEEADGETASIEITEAGLLYLNIYTEDTPGNKILKRVPLGGLERGKRNLINDFYDDPRIGHT